jgi:hypothetical protein
MRKRVFRTSLRQNPRFSNKVRGLMVGIKLAHLVKKIQTKTKGRNDEKKTNYIASCRYNSFEQPGMGTIRR